MDTVFFLFINFCLPFLHFLFRTSRLLSFLIDPFLFLFVFGLFYLPSLFLHFSSSSILCFLSVFSSLNSSFAISSDLIYIFFPLSFVFVYYFKYSQLFFSFHSSLFFHLRFSFFFLWPIFLTLFLLDSRFLSKTIFYFPFTSYIISSTLPFIINQPTVVYLEGTRIKDCHLID